MPSLSCCDRALLRKPKRVRRGVQRIEDPIIREAPENLRSPGQNAQAVKSQNPTTILGYALSARKSSPTNDIVPDFSKIGNHTFRATGITAYLRNGGKLEIAQQIAAHESSRTTGLYDRRDDDVALDEVERIVI